MPSMLRLALAGICAMGLLRAASDAAGFVLAPKPSACRRMAARVTRRAADEADPEKPKGIQEMAKEMGEQLPDLEALDAMMKDPEKAKEAQAKAQEMMKDPETRAAMEGWTAAVSQTVAKLAEDPEMKDLLAEIKEKGVSAWSKFKDNERVMEKIAAVQRDLNEELVKDQAERELQEELVKEIFDKFDEDKDGFLNLAEFNALQAATEGEDSVYEQKQLEELQLAINSKTEDPSRGMPFADYRRLYLDWSLKKQYGTDVVADHGKIFGSNHGTPEAGSIPNAEVPSDLFKD